VLHTQLTAHKLTRLDDFGWCHVELGTKHPVPEAACHAKPVLIVGKVVLEMILLQLLVVGG